MTFDLDLWPTDLNINRGHLLIKDYLPTKFESSGAKRSWVISCTRLRATDIPTYRHTDRPTCAKQYAPPFSKGGIQILIWLSPSTKAPLPKKKSKNQLQLTTKKATTNFYYTTIADRLRTVSWSTRQKGGDLTQSYDKSPYNHPTGMVKPVYGY